MSKTKTVMFHFKDGPQEVKIGQTVYFVPYDRRDVRTKYVIKTIGKKYIGIGYSDSVREFSRFEIVTGKEKTEYIGAALYSSKEAYDKHTAECKVVDDLKDYLRNYATTITYPQALKIREILGITG